MQINLFENLTTNLNIPTTSDTDLLNSNQHNSFLDIMEEVESILPSLADIDTLQGDLNVSSEEEPLDVLLEECTDPNLHTQEDIILSMNNMSINSPINQDSNNTNHNINQDSNNTNHNINQDSNNTNYHISQGATKNHKIGANNKDVLKYNLENNTYTMITSSIESENTAVNELEFKNIETFDSILSSVETEQLMSIDSLDNDSVLTGITNNTVEIDEKTFSQEILNTSNSDELSENILNQIHTGLKNTSTPKNMNIMLKPQQLGNVNVKIKFLPTGMQVEIVVDNEIAQNAIMNNLEKLEHIISPNNDLNIASINISQRKERQLKEREEFEHSLKIIKSKHILKSKRVNPIFYKNKN